MAFTATGCPSSVWLLCSYSVSLPLLLHGFRAATKELKAAKGALQSQLKGMVAAEQELTTHLKVGFSDRSQLSRALGLLCSLFSYTISP